MSTNSIELIGALAQFRMAWSRLESVWSHEHLDNADYPFAKSFNELSLDVDTWCMISTSNIQCAELTNDLYKQLTDCPLTGGELEYVLDTMREQLHVDYPELGN